MTLRDWETDRRINFFVARSCVQIGTTPPDFHFSVLAKIGLWAGHAVCKLCCFLNIQCLLVVASLLVLPAVSFFLDFRAFLILQPPLQDPYLSKK